MRVIAATNRNLREMIAQGTFREDLFYRLNVIHLTVPPLRDRREDIPALVAQFLSRFTHANGSAIAELSPPAMQALHEYSWPGNVRELENVIERLVVTVSRRTVELAGPAGGNPGSRSGLDSAQARTASNHCRRPVQAARRAEGIILDDGVSAVHGPRPHARLTFVNSCDAVWKKPEATIASWPVSSTWSRAITNGFSTSCASTTARFHFEITGDQ